MVPKIFCGVCTNPVVCKRYGAAGCAACAAFFIRSLESQKSFKCKGTNECLKNPSILAKGCQRCRFDKCLEIGMAADDELPVSSSSSPPPPPPPDPTPIKPNPALEKNNLFAAIMNSILTASQICPNLVVAYLEGNTNQDIISTSLTKIKNLPLAPLLEKTHYLKTLFNIFPISQAEFPILLKLSICKITFKWLSVENQLRISTLQHYNFLNLNKMGLDDHRILELTVLSQSLLNIFYAYN